MQILFQNKTVIKMDESSDNNDDTSVAHMAKKFNGFNEEESASLYGQVLLILYIIITLFLI